MNLSHNTREVSCALGVVLVVLGVSGCVNPDGPCSHSSHAVRRVIPTDPAYGYRPTCWRPWQDACMGSGAGCPMPEIDWPPLEEGDSGDRAQSAEAERAPGAEAIPSPPPLPPPANPPATLPQPPRAPLPGVPVEPGRESTWEPAGHSTGAEPAKAGITRGVLIPTASATTSPPVPDPRAVRLVSAELLDIAPLPCATFGKSRADIQPCTATEATLTALRIWCIAGPASESYVAHGSLGLKNRLK